MNITLIIDASGSMNDQTQTVRESVRDLIKANKEATFNIIDFAEDIKVVAENAPYDAPEVKGYEYTTRGATSLYDAIGEAASIIDPAEKTLVVIVTDGLENYSKNWSGPHIKALLKAWQTMNPDNFEVMFIGVEGIDTMDTYGSTLDLGVTYSGSVADSLSFAATNACFMASGASASVRSEELVTLAADIDISIDKRDRRKGKSAKARLGK